MRGTIIACCVMLALAGCTKEQATDELGAVKKAEAAAAKTAAQESVSAAEPLGVDECDSYLQKYESCLADKVPPHDQQVYRTKLEYQRQMWEKMAADPTAHDALVKQCKDAAAAATEQFGSIGCQF